MYLVPLVLSLTVHEFAHAWSAYRLGDDTAAREGRMTLNPLVHIDLVGTIVLPLLGIPFGWAKPVPIDPTRFRRDVRMGTGMAITAGAGPLSNVVLAILATVVFGLLIRFAPETLAGTPALDALLKAIIGINVSLAIFNLLPVPPLDGSRIVEAFIPTRLRGGWEAFARIAPFLLIGVVVYGGALTAGPRRLFFGLLQRILDAII